MTLKFAPLAVAALALFAAAGSHAAYMKLSDAGGAVSFFAGNSGGDPFSYSANGVSWGSTAANSGANTVADRSLYNSGAAAYTDYSVYFIADGLLVAELEFDYIGNLAGYSGVQKITYNNYVAQGISLAAPASGANVRSMNLASGNYSGPGDFGSQTAGIYFYNDGIVVSASAVSALGNAVPEPGSLALASLALGLAGFTAARRRA